MRTSPRTKSSTLWDNSPANTSLSVPDHPLTGGICLSPSFSQTKFLQPLEQSVRPQTFYGPKTSTHWRKTPTDGPPSIQIPPPTGGFFRVSWGGARQQTNDRQHATGPPQRHAQEHPTETNKKKGSRGVAPGGNPREIRKGPSGNPLGDSTGRSSKQLNAAARYSPTPSRVQYHRRSQALASGFGKGPGVSPGP